MYDLNLTSEQLEFRDALRDFVTREVKPAAIDPKRLEPFEKPLMMPLLRQASEMGLRALPLPEEAGGAGADALTTCLLLEEIAAGDVDLAVVLGETALIARQCHAGAMSDEQRGRWLGNFAEDPDFHLSLVARDAQQERGWSYHGALPDDDEPVGAPDLSAKRDGKGWIIDGLAPFVANAPLAKLFIVQAKADSGVVTLIVPRDAKGLSVSDALPAFGGDGERTRWHHGACGPVAFEGCRVGDADVIAADAALRLLQDEFFARRTVQLAAINVGVAQAAHEAAIEYAKIRWQGGRYIVEHQAIGMKLADVAMQIEAARALVHKAAWISDHPEAAQQGSVSDLPWPVVARNFAGHALHHATLESAECFGAMGVMRDMPLQKYVHDTLVLKHSADCDLTTPLVLAETLAGFKR